MANVPILQWLWNLSLQCIHQIDTSGNTVFDYAARKDQCQVLKGPLNTGAKLNCVNAKGQILLHSAALGGPVEAL